MDDEQFNNNATEPRKTRKTGKKIFASVNIPEIPKNHSPQTRPNLHGNSMKKKYM